MSTVVAPARMPDAGRAPPVPLRVPIKGIVESKPSARRVLEALPVLFCGAGHRGRAGRVSAQVLLRPFLICATHARRRLLASAAVILLVREPDGRYVELTWDAWAHALERHPHLSGWLHEVVLTIEHPEHQEPDARPGRERLFRRPRRSR